MSNKAKKNVDVNGIERWYFEGRLHREDGPAVIRPNGSLRWYQNGELHREDGPAAIHPDGRQRWFLNGEQYSESEWLKMVG